LICLNQIRTKIGVMYGDPTTTPGGKAIPFHSSVRIKLGAGQQITDKNKNVIGINVSAKTIKNKVAPPFRTVNFEIHFGKGIVEHEQVFDLLRKHGPESIENVEISISGTGSWKSLTAVNQETGEVLVDKKFYKADFDKIMKDPEYEPYCNMLLEKAMIRVMDSSESQDFDSESYEEVRAVSMDITQEIVNPEA